jgi:hypothetical protein
VGLYLDVVLIQPFCIVKASGRAISTILQYKEPGRDVGFFIYANVWYREEWEKTIILSIFTMLLVLS